MSRLSSLPAAKTFLAPDAPSLADIARRIETDPDLAPTRRRDLLAALRRVPAILDLRPEDLPAHPPTLRPLLTEVVPVAAGLSPKTWRNLTGDLAAALRVAGIHARSAEVRLEGAWGTLWTRVQASGDKRLLTALPRFLRWCAAAGLAPGDVTQDALLRWRDDLDAAQLNRDPHGAAYAAARAWNLASDRIESWPATRLTPPNRSRVFALPWDFFPPGLARSVDAYLDRCASEDPFELDLPPHPLSPASRRQRRGHLQRAASAAVAAGVPAERLDHLDALLRLDVLEPALRWQLDRHGGRPTPGLGNAVLALRHAARWRAPNPARVTGEDARLMAALDDWVRRFGRHERGMREKNRRRVEPFHDEAAVRRLLEVPDRLDAKAATTRDATRAATTRETALAVAILTFFPLRLKELLALQVDAHVRPIGRGRRRGLRLALPAALVKNGAPREADLPSDLAERLARFVEEDRPALAAPGNPHLFAHRSAEGPLARTTLVRRLSAALRDLAGLEMSPHNFRHAAGVIHLSHAPGDLDAVRRVLGHKSLETTRAHYDYLDAADANRRYAESLEASRRRGRG